MHIIHGGRWGTPVPAAASPPAYHLEVNCCGITYVWFQQSPTRNLYDCVMTLAEAIERGFVLVPRDLGVVRAEGRR